MLLLILVFLFIMASSTGAVKCVIDQTFFNKHNFAAKSIEMKHKLDHLKALLDLEIQPIRRLNFFLLL